MFARGRPGVGRYADPCQGWEVTGAAAGKLSALSPSMRSDRPEVAPIVYSQKLAAPSPPAAIIAALSTATGLSSWWAPTTSIQGRLAVSFPTSDEPLVVRVSEVGSTIRWMVERCDVLPEWVGTSPHFTLVPRADGWTEIEFVHCGLHAQLSCFSRSVTDWDYLLWNCLLPNLPR